MPSSDRAACRREQAFDAAFRRYQADQALGMDRVAKVASLAMWGAAGAKLASRGFILHAALAASCCLSSASLLAYSCWRRCCYTRRAAALTAAALLQAHAVAAAVCLSGFQLMAGRHSDNFFRFMFINLLHHMGAFQALATLNSWPMLGMRLLLPVQLASAAFMVPRLPGLCRAALDSDDGAPRLFSGANWALRQAFSVVDTRPFQAWQPSGRALHEAECMQVGLWWLLLCCAASAYASWMKEQAAKERFAQQLGPGGHHHLRRLQQRHPLYSHHRPALLVAVELYAMAAALWEAVRAVLPLALSPAGTAALGGGGMDSSAGGGTEPLAASSLLQQHSEL